MDQFYLEIRTVHIWAIFASGSLFLFRALALNLFGATWARAVPLRILSYTIDTILLTAALMLTTIVRQYPFVDAWLTVKVVLLLVYITLGWFAVRSPLRTHRLGFTVAAVLVFLFIYSVARAHHPLGILASFV